MPRKKHNLTCPKCYSSRVQKSRAKGLEIVIIRFFPAQTYRCLFCYRRFWLWQKSSSGRRRFSNWLILLGFLVPMSLCYQWLFVPYLRQASTELGNDQAVTNPIRTRATDSTIRTPDLFGFDDQRDLVSSLAFNQPDNDLEEAGLLEVPKLELEEKLAEAKTKVESANAAALLLEQRNAKRADITEELRSLLKVDINYTIERWRQAWQSGDAEIYLRYYSALFEPTGDIPLATWQLQRKLRVMPSKQISLTLSNFEVVLDETNQRSTVSFDQEYQSRSYSDKIRKQLTLIKEDEWRIVSEESLTL